MKTKLFMIALALMLSQVFVKAQVAETTIELLTAHIWESNKSINGISKETRYIQFTNEKILNTIVTDEHTFFSESFYYLTNSTEEDFDMNKIGQVTNGKYIYIYSPDNDMANFLVIAELTEQKFKYITIQNVWYAEMRGHAPREMDYTVCYPKRKN
ncbi:MAG: hypothetical protein LIO79_00405 [Rikenellaceae bacterium]|nr:hypothetical protein [Rikenellaceae bacterium]